MSCICLFIIIFLYKTMSFKAATPCGLSPHHTLQLLDHVREKVRRIMLGYWRTSDLKTVRLNKLVTKLFLFLLSNSGKGFWVTFVSQRCVTINTRCVCHVCTYTHILYQEPVRSSNTVYTPCSGAWEQAFKAKMEALSMVRKGYQLHFI